MESHAPFLSGGQDLNVLYNLFRIMTVVIISHIVITLLMLTSPPICFFSPDPIISSTGMNLLTVCRKLYNKQEVLLL